MEKAGLQSQEIYMVNEEVAPIFRVLAKPDALKILHLTGEGIVNATYAREKLGLSQKRYYTRMTALLDVNLIKKKNGVYRQTALGRILYGRFLPAIGRAVDAKDELELIMELDGTELENDVKKRILEELGIPDFTDSNMKTLDSYEALAVEAIDLYDSAEKSVFLASNYFDVRVIESFLRGVGRGITNKVIMGKNRQSSKLQNLRMMLSLTFSKTLIDFASNIEELKKTVRFTEIPYTFCVVDGHHNIIEISDNFNENFIVALSIDDKDVASKLTKLHNTLWEAGEFQSAVEGFNYINSG
jgi:predicted transcriptional regulator